MKTRTSVRFAQLAAIAAGAVGALILAPSALAQEAPTIAVTEVDLVNDTIDITNTGDADVDVNGLILCNFPAYAPIEGADPIPAGATITVDAGALGIDLADDQGEMGLYSVPEYENPDAILTYVEWGNDGHVRAPVAVAAGIWDGGFVEAGDVLRSNTNAPVAAADWSAGGAAPELAATGAETWTLVLVAGALLVLGGGAGLGSRLGRRRVRA